MNLWIYHELDGGLKVRMENCCKEVTVIGGGLAGVCAAIAAARLGVQVALVQNRPVLGGNSSSEVRVWVCGATGHGVNRYARETGIMGELFLENQFRNPDGNPYLWDLVVLEAVKAEPNIELFLNTDVHEVEAAGPEDNRQITQVTGWMMGSERRIRFQSDVYIDCTGDGLIGFLAGAKFRIGREAKREYNEDWAPEIADDITLGSTILFYTKDVGHPVKFVPPSLAKNINETPIPLNRVIKSGDSGCHYWWIEWGGELDTVHDNERIRDELWSVIYGIWDYIKNSGKFDADNMTLEWVGSLPGKREYRRFEGDYVLNQNDIVNQEPFLDRVAFGGWSIDLHPPQGMYAETSGSKHYHTDGIYHIPFRSLYSRNVNNLLFAGRNISATHVAFGSTRVMATCAVMGEAAGTGAAICAASVVTPRELGEKRMAELHQTLLRQDASIIGIKHDDADDLAKRATIAASSTLGQLRADQANETYALNHPVGLLIPVEPALDQFSLRIDATEAAELSIEIWDTGRAENYIPVNLVNTHSKRVAKGEKQWVSFDVNWNPGVAQNAFIVVQANPSIRLYRTDEPLYGTLTFQNKSSATRDFGDYSETKKTMVWKMHDLNRKLFCFRVSPETTAYRPEKLVDGYLRPYGGPHLWMSERMKTGSQGIEEEWISLTWEEDTAITELHLLFNDDVNEDLINLHHHRTPFEAIPEIVKNYRLEANVNGEWVVIHRERKNYKRKRVHTFAIQIRTNAVKVVIEETNGCSHAQMVAIRCYNRNP
jgi:hypothetical protein